MERLSNAQGTIDFSQMKDGKKQEKWQSGRIFSAQKTCPYCGTQFKPWMILDGEKILRVQKEGLWKKQIYCSVKCAKRSSPTVLNAQARAKIKQKLKEIRHKPIARGGNGQLLPFPQLALLHALGIGWEAEYSIKTQAGHRNGIYPNCYKVDIANPEKKIAIELDGSSHNSLDRQEQDKKKTEYLVRLGWSVYRVSNEKAINLYTTYKSQDILLTSLME